MVNRRFIILLLCSCPLASMVYCQDTTGSKPGFQQQDIKDWLVQKKILKYKPPKKNFLLLIPVIASNPTAGFMFGAGMTYAFKVKGTGTKMSTATANATYSTKGLVNLNMKSNAFFANDRLVLNGDWRYLINFETTYGLGTKRYESGEVDINGFQTSSDSLGEHLEYHQVRIHETASWKLFKNIFAGLGLHYDYYYDIEDKTLESGDSAGSYHYQYSINHGFNPKAYTAMGFSLNFLLDSRDNQINAYRGSYANINYRVNLTALGSTQNSTMLLTEYRTFIPLDGQKERNILAFWLYGSFVTSGNVPYLLLPALGYDQRQRTGRGYTFGRFRGEDMAYGESEYRFPISPNTGILGGVAFINCTTTADKQNEIHLFDYMRLGYGGGLRIMMDKRSRTRLEVDAGIADKSVGFYLGAQETF